MHRAHSTPTFGYPAEPSALSALFMAALLERWRLRNGMSRGGIHSKGRDLHSQTRRSRLRSRNTIDIKLHRKNIADAMVAVHADPKNVCKVRLPSTVFATQNVMAPTAAARPTHEVKA